MALSLLGAKASQAQTQSQIPVPYLTSACAHDLVAVYGGPPPSRDLIGAAFRGVQDPKSTLDACRQLYERGGHRAAGLWYAYAQQAAGHHAEALATLIHAYPGERPSRMWADDAVRAAALRQVLQTRVWGADAGTSSPHPYLAPLSLARKWWIWPKCMGRAWCLLIGW